MPPDLTDSQIIDHLAEEVARRIMARHPRASAKFRRLLVRLYTRQLTGLVPAPGDITNDDLSHHLQVDPRRLSEDYASATTKLQHHPEARALAAAYLNRVTDH